MPDPKPILDKAEARKRLDVKRDAFLAITGDDDTERYHCGELYNEVVDQGLAVGAGYKTAQEFVVAELKGTVAASSLRKYAAVAKVFSEAAANSLGMTKLNTLLTLSNLLPLGTLPPDPSDLPITLKDNKVKPFKECSKADLSAVVKALKGAVSEGLPPEEAAEVERRQKILDATLGEDSAARVKAHAKGGEVYYDLVGVPHDRFVEVLQALAAGK